ncbi:MAG: ATP-binding protein [Planctomycetota bacterium]|nr:MAG: ATP-binding protein [Planctomycetota bacterium]
MPKSQKLKIRPYARLLTMLGEQLIKNERIALIELIKNSYDADASWVKVTFKGFGPKYEIKKKSKIIIEDDGIGMKANVIKKHWLNPATPEKKIRKKKKATTRKGRVIQGEKGIGRYAILKLGKNIRIITKPKGIKNEHIVDFNFSKYDNDFLEENGEPIELFIDDLAIPFETRKPLIIKKESIKFGVRKITRLPHGTRIEISDLKGSWTENKVERVYKDITKLQSIFQSVIKERKKTIEGDFQVWVYKDDKLQKYHENYVEQLNALFKRQAVFKIEKGRYNEDKQEFTFRINGKPKAIKLRDTKLAGLKTFKDYFGNKGEILDERPTECGSFEFGFYIFMAPRKAPPKYLLDKEDWKLIKSHRIYLYRDGLRVYPYGEPEDDWLRIDVLRGIVAAGHFLSNDQVVGYINISQANNPKLMDKTNREGLLEQGNATDDFIILIQTFLAYLRRGPYAQYLEGYKSKKAQDVFRTEQISLRFEELKTEFKGKNKALKIISKVEKEYKTEREYLVQRAETTEELAGVGLSVEVASHDIMLIMSKAMILIDSVIKETMLDVKIDKNELQKELQALRGMLSFIEAQLKDIQLLFKSSKKKIRLIEIKDIIDKVMRIYKRQFKDEGILFQIKKKGSPLKAKTTDAVLLQLLLNLFDNAVYWLQTMNRKKKKIEILLDGNNGKMVFSDDGPGVDKDDAPYIFEPFYSGKGVEGRGLGLYIARQLLERHDYTIELARFKSERILSGANFVVCFIPEDD